MPAADYYFAALPPEGAVSLLENRVPTILLFAAPIYESCFCENFSLQFPAPATPVATCEETKDRFVRRERLPLSLHQVCVPTRLLFCARQAGQRPGKTGSELSSISS